MEGGALKMEGGALNTKRGALKMEGGALNMEGGALNIKRGALNIKNRMNLGSPKPTTTFSHIEEQFEWNDPYSMLFLPSSSIQAYPYTYLKDKCVLTYQPRCSCQISC